MRTLRNAFVLGGALAVVALLSTGAPAADKDQVIKDRQAQMKRQGGDMGAVKGFLEDKNDLATATTKATDLVESIKNIPTVFPAGSDGPNPEGKYTTKPEIWSDAKGFSAAVDTAEQKATALLAAVKAGDKAAIQTAFSDMGKNGCGGCHEKFREEIKK